MKTENIRLIKKIAAVIAAAIMIASFLSYSIYADDTIRVVIEPESDSTTWELWPQTSSMYSATAALIDVETGALLYSKGGFESKYPASITKLMTALLVLENDDLDATVTMTAEGVADAYDGSSNIQPTIGESFSVLDCLKMLLVKSANDVATQLAVFTSGSVEAFANLMNERAVSLGCVNTHFANASGLHNPDHYTCCYDIAVIMGELLKYDLVRDIIAQPYITIEATPYHDTRVYETHVDLMKEGYPTYEYCIGGKTGYTDESNCTLACAAVKDDRMLVAVVMDVDNYGLASDDMINMFEYGFSLFEKYEVYEGVPKVEEGGAILPNGVSVDSLNESIEETDEYVLASYEYNGHYVGHSLMTKSDYYYYVLGITIPEEKETAASNEESLDESTSSDDENTLVAESDDPGDNSVRMVNTAAVVIACVVIASAAVTFFLYVRWVRRERERKRREARRRRRGG